MSTMPGTAATDRRGAGRGSSWLVERWGGGAGMTHRAWRCRNLSCATADGIVLGRLTADGNGLVLAPGVAIAAVYLDVGRVEIACPECGAVRDFRGLLVRRGNS